MINTLQHCKSTDRTSQEDASSCRIVSEAKLTSDGNSELVGERKYLLREPKNCVYFLSGTQTVLFKPFETLPFGCSVNIIFHIFVVNFVSEAVSVTLIADKNHSVSLESH